MESSDKFNFKFKVTARFSIIMQQISIKCYKTVFSFYCLNVSQLIIPFIKTREIKRNFCSISVACTRANSIALAWSRTCYREELSLSAFLLCLEDKHPCRTWARISRSVFSKSHVEARVHSLVWQTSKFSSGFCRARRNLKISYDVFFWGVKWSVSNFFAVSYSLGIVEPSSVVVVAPLPFCWSVKLW